MKIFSAKYFGIVMAVFLAAFSVCPQQTEARASDGAMPGFTKELTARQQAAVKKIWSENATVRKDLRKALAAKRGELAAMMKSGEIDNARVESISKEIGELRGKLLVEGVETHAKLVKAGLPVGPIKFSDRGGRYDSNNLMPRLNKKLSAEQKAKAQKILDNNASARLEINQAITTKRAELTELMNSKEPDKGKIENLSAEIGEARGKLLVDRIALQKEFKKAGLPDNSLDKGARPVKKKKPEKNPTKENKEKSEAAKSVN